MSNPNQRLLSSAEILAATRSAASARARANSTPTFVAWSPPAHLPTDRSLSDASLQLNMAEFRPLQTTVDSPGASPEQTIDHAHPAGQDKPGVEIHGEQPFHLRLKDQ
jgi:hypothetical protein